MLATYLHKSDALVQGLVRDLRCKTLVTQGCNKPVLNLVEGRSPLHRMVWFRRIGFRSGLSSSPSLHFHPGTTHFAGYRLRQFADIWLCDLLWCSQAPDDFRLSLPANFPVAGKGCQNIIVTKILTIRLEIFRGLAQFLSKLDKGISEAVRVKVG